MTPPSPWKQGRNKGRKSCCGLAAYSGFAIRVLCASQEKNGSRQFPSLQCRLPPAACGVGAVVVDLLVRRRQEKREAPAARPPGESFSAPARSLPFQIKSRAGHPRFRRDSSAAAAVTSDRDHRISHARLRTCTRASKIILL